MTTATRTGREPLVAVICGVPLLAEAMAAALDGIAEIRTFRRDVADLDGLLRSLDPDAVIVDTAEQAAASERFSREASVPLIHVLIRESALRVLRDGVWVHSADRNGASPEAIRNALVARLFGRSQHA